MFSNHKKAEGMMKKKYFIHKHITLITLPNILWLEFKIFNPIWDLIRLSTNIMHMQIIDTTKSFIRLAPKNEHQDSVEMIQVK